MWIRRYYRDGTNDGLSVNPITDLASKSGQTILIVAKTLDTSRTAQYIQAGEDGNTGLDDTYIRQSGGTYNIALGGGFATGSVVDGGIHILTVRFDGTQTGNSNRLKFKKIECTHNRKTNEYHPHLHLIIQGKEQAELLKNYWIKQMRKRYGRNKVSNKAQDIKPIGNTEKDYIEVFKYATKGSVKDTFEASAEDLMIEALEGLQIFKPIGKLRKVKAPKEEVQEQTKADWIEPKNEIYTYCDIERDYISASNERLIGTQTIDELTEIKATINTNLNQQANGRKTIQSGSGQRECSISSISNNRTRSFIQSNGESTKQKAFYIRP